MRWRRKQEPLQPPDIRAEDTVFVRGITWGLCRVSFVLDGGHMAAVVGNSAAFYCPTSEMELRERPST